MKRLRSSEDLESFGEKGVIKDWGRREDESGSNRSLMHRSSSYYKAENGRKGLSSSSSRYDRVEDERVSPRPVRKRSDYDVDSHDRRKIYDRYREGGTSERVISSSSPRSGYGAERIHRSESFSGIKRDVPKGFRSERDRSRREGSVSSWRRFGQGKDGDESGKASRVESDEIGKAKSPQMFKDAKSPPWSRDSGSEQSRSIEVKRSEDLPVESSGNKRNEDFPVDSSGNKRGEDLSVETRGNKRGEDLPLESGGNKRGEDLPVESSGNKRSEDLPVESSGNNSEMEEGELEPDPQPQPQPLTYTKDAAEDQASDRLQHSQMELEGESSMQQDPLEKKENAQPMSTEPKESGEQDEQVEGSLSQKHGSSKEGYDLANCRNVSQLTNGGYVENASLVDNEGGREEKSSQPALTWKEELRVSLTHEGKVIELKRDESESPEQNERLMEGSGECFAVSAPVVKEINDSFKDKGKTVASSNNIAVMDAVSEFRGSLACKEAYHEGPSSRGLDLFSCDPVRKHEKESKWSNIKPKDEKLTLDLSLSLPNVLLPIDSHNNVQAPASPSHGRSVQSYHSSFRSDSEGFTASMSFSGSQYFTHNPSCSLNNDAFDNEQSVKSRPLFQGVDWQALASDETKHKDLPLIVQKLLADGNGLHQPYQTSQGNSSIPNVTLANRSIEGASRTPVAPERELSFGKQRSGVFSHHVPPEIQSLSQGAGSQENGSAYLREIKQAVGVKNGGNVYKSSKPDGREHQLNVGADMLESVMTMIVSEPLNVVTQRFREMSGQQVAYIKDSIRNTIQSPNRQRQLLAIQRALQKRPNVTLEMLLKLHQPLLEIMVAVKTGVAEYIYPSTDVTPPAMAEIFLYTRCRNPTCQSLLPVDECDCKVCAQKNGFCRECMCLVCSKFDMANNTCSWVGCDVCLHWCHVDCGLRESYIRNGRSAAGLDSPSEMQFHCVACNHPSEMFGFVKEVFLTFAKDWSAENLSRELEHVRRIFYASEDSRGKHLHQIAIQMLLKLENKVSLQEVKKHIMDFLTDSDSLKHLSTSSMARKDLSMRNDGKSNGIAGSSQEPQWAKSVSFDRTSQLDKPSGLFPKEMEKAELQVSMPKDRCFDELESIVRVKHAESKMFEGRADDARREAAALKRIAATKKERIEEEYGSRIAKLRLSDAEDMRRQKLEELQGLERGFQDYYHLKMRMEADIKDLLLKMDATRRNLSL